MNQYRLEVTHHPKFTAQQLATHLAEAYQNARLHDQQALDYATQANSERTKAIEMRDVLSQIRRDPSRESLVVINPKTGRPRRMNPYKTYSESALRDQLKTHENQATDFDIQATNFRAAAAKARSEIDRIQGELHNTRE